MLKILATDLDKTLLPNGSAPYDGTIPLLKDLIEQYDIDIVYVTARRVANVVSSVMTRYTPPQASYIIGAVGAEMYDCTGDKMLEVDAWKQCIFSNSPEWNRNLICETVEYYFPDLVMQPDCEQTDFKISYFWYDTKRFSLLESALQEIVEDAFAGTPLVTCSTDLNAGYCYVDITPKIVSKKSALEFLMNTLQVQRENVLFAGDSGNDLSVFLSSFDSLVVSNAEQNIKDRVLKEKRTGSLHIAEGINGMNGNYSSGILEGLIHKEWIPADSGIDTCS